MYIEPPELPPFEQHLAQLPTMAALSCKPEGQFIELPEIGNLSECVTLNRCGALLDDINAPTQTTLFCGFDETEQKMMICCPPELVTEPKVRPDVESESSNMSLVRITV